MNKEFDREFNRKWDFGGHRKKYSAAELRKKIIDLTIKLNHTPTMSEFESEYGKSSSAIAARRFGSWSGAILACCPNIIERDGEPDIIVEPQKTRVNTNDAIRELKRVSKKLGYVPSRREYDEFAKIDSGRIIYSFGSWRAAIKAARLNTSRWDKHGDERMLEELRRISKQLGFVPKRKEYDKAEGVAISSRTIVRRYGDWELALAEANLFRQYFYEQRKALYGF